MPREVSDKEIVREALDLYAEDLREDDDAFNNRLADRAESVNVEALFADEAKPESEAPAEVAAIEERIIREIRNLRVLADGVDAAVQNGLRARGPLGSTDILTSAAFKIDALIAERQLRYDIAAGR